MPHYAFSMIRTSVTLPKDVAAELRRQGPDMPRRSRIVARALRAYFKKGPEPSGDLDILNANAEELNDEAQEVLEFQRFP